MLIRKFSCSVCNQDYELCEHEVDKIYNKIKCEALLAEWNGRNVSIVSKPSDRRAKMTDMLIIKKNAIKKEYSWRSLQADEKNNRFRRIKRAMLKGLIDKHTASHFNEFFNLNWQGTSTYIIYKD